MENSQIADIFDEIADLIEIQGGNPFRVRSYRSAARTARDLSQRLEDLVAQHEDLSKLPHLGESTASKIREIVETGTCQRLEQLRKEIPPGVAELMAVPQLGPRKVMEIHQELGIEDLKGLRQACEARRIRELPGMGPKTEENILKGLEVLEGASGRFLQKAASEHVTSLGRHLDSIDAIKRWEVAGSFRRKKETIGDLDILVEARDRDAALEGILEYEAIGEVLSRGRERSSVRLESGLQVDFRFFEKASFGSALLYFTGSKSHNISLRKRAQSHGWKLNEYGLSKGDRRLAARSEEAIYHRLGMQWIVPELREDRGEVEAAERGELPELVELDDLRGDLHAHSDVTDGAASVEEMAEAALERGYDYLAITDHSQRVTMARGLDEDGLRQHADHIRSVDEDYEDLWLLAGVEVDILADGRLDLDEKLLAEMDWVVASVHYDTAMDESQMTDRLRTAISSGVVHALGHPLNRLIGKREGIHFDADAIFAACVERAREAGASFVISTDAHMPVDMDFMPLGVSVARRGWLGRKDVINTRTRRQLEKWLRGSRG